jgi:hypothetical protein
MKSVQLLDKNIVKEISFKEASFLLRGNQARLINTNTPTIILECNNFKKQKDIGYLTSLQREYYQNIVVQNPEGEAIFLCNQKEALWYLCKDLAEFIDTTHLTIKLKFRPKGNGKKGDNFYLSVKENICVCCGEQNSLTRHHIVPRRFRKFFPKSIKSHSSHDILLLCGECHLKYEKEVCFFEEEVRNKLGIFHEQIKLTAHEKKMDYFSRLANNLVQYSHLIPQKKFVLLQNKIATFLGKMPNQDDLVALSKIKVTTKFCSNMAEKMQNINYQEFVEMWRNHFITTLEPKFLPLYWDVSRSVEI